MAAQGRLPTAKRFHILGHGKQNTALGSEASKERHKPIRVPQTLVQPLQSGPPNSQGKGRLRSPPTIESHGRIFVRRKCVACRQTGSRYNRLPTDGSPSPGQPTFVREKNSAKVVLPFDSPPADQYIKRLACVRRRSQEKFDAERIPQNEVNGGIRSLSNGQRKESPEWVGVP